MYIEVLIDGRAPRRWHKHLVERLGTMPGMIVRTRRVTGTGPLVSADLLFMLERTLYRVGTANPVDLIDPADLAMLSTRRPADLVIDLAGVSSADPRSPTLHLRCNGQAPDPGALEAILSGSVPVLSLDYLADGGHRTVARWAVAVEESRVAIRGVSTVYGRAVQLVAGAVAAIADGHDPHSLSLGLADETPVANQRPGPLRFGATTLAQRVTDRLRKHLGTAPRWLVGWRRIEAEPSGIPSLHGGRFHRLPDDGRRFFADPFVWRSGGRDVLLVEEFPFETGKGIISAAEIGPDGTVSAVRPVLELDCHLSYPFLLMHDGEIYMVPETSARRTVELWRAVSFPDRWEQTAVLIADADLGDATLLRRGDVWFLFAASRDTWTSSWDALSIWTAPSLTGPWRPLPADPVLVDVASARPAGGMIEVDGRLIRPAQDSRGGYGAGIVFATVDRLDAGGFSQTVVDRVRPKRPLAGLHTYNRAGALEVIDVFGPATGDAFTVT